MYRRYLAGIYGLPPEDLDMSSMAAFRANYHKKCSINTVALVPHAAVRLETVGFRDVPLRGELLDKAKRLVREGMEQGAVGFSTGMSYYPNSYSDTYEMIELCRPCHEADGVYVTHLRNHNVERGFGGGGVPEALEIGRRSGVPVHFSHYRTSPDNAGQVSQIMELIDKAKAEGVDVSLELYPYPTGSGYPLYFFPGPFHEGGTDAIMARLNDDKERHKWAHWVDLHYAGRLDESVFTFLHSEKNRQLEGMSWADVAKARGVSIGTMICDVMREEELRLGFRGAPPHSVALWRQVSVDVMRLLSRPDYMVGSDAIPLGGLPHPRAFGTFPRVVGRLRRQTGILTLEQAVQRLTDNPARRFGLKKRGRIEKGHYADIVVFDAQRITDTATYEDPRSYPLGIPFVLVNGQVAVDHERCTGVLAGQAVP
jgi:N-acyl-D-amino-acid deacylase